jgi:hypothetical protein
MILAMGFIIRKPRDKIGEHHIAAGSFVQSSL